jgi:hypothetical protein
VSGLTWNDAPTSIVGKLFVENELLFPTFNLPYLLSFQDAGAVSDTLAEAFLAS